MPDAKLILAGALVVLACIVLVALVKSRRRGGPMLTQSSALPPLKGSLGANAHGRRFHLAVGREILELLETGRRAEALALMRERTGWSAEEAEAWLAKLERLKERLES